MSPTNPTPDSDTVAPDRPIDLSTRAGQDMLLQVFFSGVASGAGTALVNLGVPDDVAAGIAKSLAAMVFSDPAIREETLTRLYEQYDNPDAPDRDDSFIVVPRT